MTNKITLEKGSYTVTIDAVNIDEEYSNPLILIKPAQTPQKQSEGPKDVKVIDLLRVTHTLKIRGHLVPTATKSADQVRSDLINIFKGGGISGGVITVTYSSHPDSPLSMFMEKLVTLEKPIDYDPSSGEKEQVKYDVQITLIEGVKA